MFDLYQCRGERAAFNSSVLNFSRRSSCQIVSARGSSWHCPNPTVWGFVGPIRVPFSVRSRAVRYVGRRPAGGAMVVLAIRIGKRHQKRGAKRVFPRSRFERDLETTHVAAHWTSTYDLSNIPRICCLGCAYALVSLDQCPFCNRPYRNRTCYPQ